MPFPYSIFLFWVFGCYRCHFNRIFKIVIFIHKFLHGKLPFSVREDSLLNSKHISPERCFVVCVIIHSGVPLFSVRVSRGGHWPPALMKLFVYPHSF